ncbi:MAG: ATP-dependent DNA helicase RecG [Candidatus Kerfeldbacteria bacterium]|nr:ATP-dependent DNA helicase RecG [Candidatus Kerfeldbacteria bacterium]
MNDLAELHGIGPTALKRLHQLGIYSVTDLLQHYPSRYEDYSQVVPIAEAPLDTAISLKVQIKKMTSRNSWQRRRFSLVDATVADDSGTLKVVWFNQNYIAEQLTVGMVIMLSGKIKQTKYGKQLVNPVFERAKAETVHTARIVPHYPTTYGLTQKQLRYFMSQALTKTVPEWLPQPLLDERQLLPYGEAIRSIHFPASDDTIEQAKFRLGFDEVLLVQLVSLVLKQSLAHETAVAIPIDEAALQQFTQQLPFTLTNGQRQAAWEMMKDLALSQPMNRLLEGDVGAGKTVVAAMAVYAVAKQGYEAVIMAPTEVLARQHWHKLTALLKPLGIKVGIMTAHHKEATTAPVVVGTQALLTEIIQFPKLALAVIDEQHRFGVAQRQLLKQKSGLGVTPHLLSMTATPIPRTLALTAYGDLALSIIDELPNNRQPITTTVVTEDERPAMYRHIAERIAAGDQVYVVAPRIEDEEGSEKTSVERERVRLEKQFPNIKMAVLHGQLPAKTKHSLMDQFHAGTLDLLISTTVIEVGVDVPNATVMVIENAEVFGLAQLHQLRGRVGRADKASYCYACTNSSQAGVIKRLQFFAQTSSGFTLAEYDLQRRGPGDVYGREQSGFLNSFKIAKLSDHKLITLAQQAAQSLFPDLSTYPVIQQRVQTALAQVHLE